VQTEVAANDRGRIAKIYPFDDRNRIIFVAQLRITGAWNAVSIETPSLTATADEIEQFIAGLQEAIRIYRAWQTDQE
jgi:hypothetical protein